MENVERKMVEIPVPDISSNAEKKLKTVAIIILVLGIFVAIVGLIVAVISFVYFFVCILCLVGCWALMNVIANISLRLKGIQETMQLKLVPELNEEKQNVSEASQNTEFVYDKRLDGIKKGDKVKEIATGKIYKVDDVDDKRIYCGSLIGGYMWYGKDKLEYVDQFKYL